MVTASTGEARWLLGERAQAANINVWPSFQVDGKLSEIEF